MKSILKVFKWIVYAIVALILLKVLVAAFTMISAGLALATLAMWGGGVLLVGGGIAFAAFKLLGSKKK